MPAIKDARYSEFRKTGMIQLMRKEEFEKILEQTSHPKDTMQARALMSLIYYTGRRPAEILELKGEHIKKEKRFMSILFKTRKGGLYHTLYFPLKNKHLKEFYVYASKIYPSQWLFYQFHSKATRKTKDGQQDYIDLSKNVWYWVKKWSGITPYFYRHNRFSLMAEAGATDAELQLAKGARDPKSIFPYKHFSKQRLEKMAKYYY
jgi:integrase